MLLSHGVTDLMGIYSIGISLLNITPVTQRVTGVRGITRLVCVNQYLIQQSAY